MKKFFKKSSFYFCVAVFLYLLSIPFIQSIFLRIMIAFLLAVPVLLSMRLYSKAREVQEAREQLKGLLELLCTKISSGRSLEKAFFESRKGLEPVYGAKSLICQSLKGFEEQIATGIAFDEAILPLSETIPCPEAFPLFHAIARTRHMGNRVLQVLRQSLGMVSELLLVTRDISSDVSQKRLESTVMAAMPFIMLWSLDFTTRSYLEPAFSKPLGSVLMLSAFVLAVFSYCIGASVISRSMYRTPRGGTNNGGASLFLLLSKFFETSLLPFPKRLVLLGKLSHFLPEKYRLSLNRTLAYLYPSKKHALEEHLFAKCSILVFCVTGYFILRLFLAIPFISCPVISVLLLFLHDVDTKSLITRNKLHMMRDFPTFIGLLSTLLSNGIVLSKAVSLGVETFRNSSKPFQNELSMLQGSILAGMPACEALESFAGRCQIPEIACALHFASQYDKTGSIENLNLLKLQCSVCWMQSKTAARRQLEESSVKLLIPMLLELVCVMIVTLTPSLMSLQTTL